MNQHIMLLLLALLDEIDGSVEEALDVLGLGVLEEKGQIGYSLRLLPVFAVITRTVDYCFDFVTLEGLPIFCHLLARNKDTVDDLVTFSLKFLLLQLVTSSCPGTKPCLAILLLLFGLGIAHSL
jgi:hypothetical protein